MEGIRDSRPGLALTRKAAFIARDPVGFFGGLYSDQRCEPAISQAVEKNTWRNWGSGGNCYLGCMRFVR